MELEERLEATISLKPVERVVCAPLIDQYAGQFSGIANREFVWNWEQSMQALDKLKEAYPVWDGNAYMQHIRHGRVAELAGSMRGKYPGVELEDNAPFQMIEFEAMTRDDYAILDSKGFSEYRLTFLERAHQKKREEVLTGLQESARLRIEELEQTRRRGQVAIWGGLAGSVPFDALSGMRSMERLFKDMFQIGRDLEKAMWVVGEATFEAGVKCAEATGVNRVFLAGSRCSGQFISKKSFERFALPYLKDLINRFAEKNIVPILHFDADWTMNLEYFLELPKGKFVLELDGSTDIFKAHEILKGHCAIMGDVPAALFTVASPSELEEYAKKLLSTFKNGEGLIYSSGCTVPINSKHENVKAFFDAAEKYGRYS